MENTLSDTQLANLPTEQEELHLQKMVVGAIPMNLGSPVLADVDRIVTLINWADGTLTIAAQPDVPRNLTVALTDVNNSVAGLLTITGLDPSGRVITETMTPAADGTGKTLTGTKIFAYVTSCVISGTSGALAGTDQLTIGVGNVIGIGIDIEHANAITHAYLDQTWLTVVAATGVSTSGINASAGTYDGTKVLQVWVMPSRQA